MVASNEVLGWVAAVPKAELHVHVDGLVDPELIALLETAGYTPPLTADRLSEIYPIDSVEKWNERYSPLVEASFEPKALWLPRLAECHIKRLILQEVKYAEIMVSGLLLELDGISETITLYRNLRETLQLAAGDEAQIELLACVGRGPRARLERQAERIFALHEAGIVCGVAYAIENAVFPVKDCTDIFKAFKDAGLGIEIHAGELEGPASVWDAVKYGYPDRVGHGLAIFEDPKLLEHVRTQNLHIEFCPTSNLCLTKYRDLAQHPIGRAIELGLNYSVNTDDPGIFQCSMNSEYQLLVDTFGVGESEFRRVFDNAMAARFGS
jgi:adenosine deaminase